MRVYPETKIAFGLIVAFMLVVAGTALTYVNSTRAIESGKSVSTGLELLAGLESLFLALRNIDRESIAYAQSGDPTALRRFTKAEKTIDAHIEYIKQLGATDVRRYVKITSMETQTRSLINLASELVRQRKKSSVNISIPSSYRDKQQSTLDLIRGRIIYMEGEEKEVIKRNNTIYEGETARLFQTYVTLGLFTVLFFFGLVFLLLRYIQSERRIAATERKVAGEIVAHAPIGIMILNEELQVVSLNPTFIAYLAADAPPVGKSVFETIPNLPDEVKHRLTQLSQVAQSTEAPPVEAKDAAILPSIDLKEHMMLLNSYWDIVMWPMIDEGAFKGLIVLAADVTDKVTANRQRQLLFNTLTHDLKNPLIGNQYLVRALLTNSNQSLSDIQREGLEKVEKGNEDILKMIKNMLEISKLSDGTSPICHDNFDLKELLNVCVEELSNLSREKKVGLTCDFPEGQMKMESDNMAVKHIALNLLENAIKFSDEGSDVNIKLESDNGMVTFSVHDKGPGIPLEEQGKLFTSVWQGAVGRRALGGSGIGMYLCGQLVQLLGGTLRCESSGSSGASFFVALPSRTTSSES